MKMDLEAVLTETMHKLNDQDPKGTGNAKDFAGFRQEIERMTDSLISAIFPDFAPEQSSLTIEERRSIYLREGAGLLKSALSRVLSRSTETEEVLYRFFEKIP